MVDHSADDNLYAAPEQSDERRQLSIDDEPVKRPVAPLIFGILSIIFNGLGVLFQPVAYFMIDMQRKTYEQMHMPLAYVKITTALGIVLSVVGLIVGIGLVRYRLWALNAFLLLCGLSILIAIGQGLYFGMILATEELEMQGTIGVATTIGSTFFAMIYPVLGLIFLTRPHVKAACD